MVDLGEVWWADFPYEDISGSKVRPVVIVGANHDTYHCVTLMVTSQNPSDDKIYEIEHWNQAGLKKPSYIRLMNKHTFHFSELINRIGCLHNNDQINLWLRIDEVYDHKIDLF